MLFRLEDARVELPDEDAYWVAPTAVLIGDVTLHNNASVWFGAILRGDNERITLGENTNVQDNCVLHTDLGFPLNIGPDCTIGHNVVLHGCTIDRNSLIGIGSTVLNGTRIGQNCVVGANTLITEDKEFPDNSLILGSPGRVVRTLEPEQTASIADAAHHYVQNWRRYRAGLTVDEREIET